jgi:hypothetical protein
LLIELRSYIRDRTSGQCKDFLEFFHKGSVICRLNQHQLHEQLKAGKVLVLFDGLDEVFDPAQREEVITDIHRFTNDYPNVRVIVTSRIIGYKPQRLRDAQFRHFLLQDLESEQIQDFIYRWHELTFTDEADKVRKRERLQQAIKTSSAIGELAGNPLLLTMMAILNRNQELPRDRPELYNQASRVLLHQWDVEQKLLENPRIDSVAIDYKDKQAMLRQVAYHMQAADQGLAGNLIRGEDLERILTSYLKSIEVSQARTVARLLIEQLRSRNFILCFLGADSYGFVHRTFLEYFCASEFVERFGKRGLEGGLTLEELKTEVFGKHWQDMSWHEVLRLIAGMIEPKFAGQIIDYLIELRDTDEWYVDAFYRHLFFAVKCLSEVRNRFEIRATADRLLNRLKGLTDDDDFMVKEDAVEAIATTWKDAPDTLILLKAVAQSDDPVGYVQARAARALAENWKDDPDTMPLLMTLAQSDEHGNLGQVAMQCLTQGWKDDPKLLPLLKTLAQSAKHCHVRETAMRGWTQRCQSDPDILPFLKKVAHSNDHWHVRAAAVEELARGWKYELDMFEFLRDRASNDPYPLEDEENKRPNPRQTALEAIIEQYRDRPQTLPLLQGRAKNDPDEKVREFAKEKLAELEKLPNPPGN